MSRRNPFSDTGNSLPENLIPTGRKTSKRKSDWNKKHAAKSYKIPAPLTGTALIVRDKILSMAQFDEADKPRQSTITADTVANIVADWAILRVKENPKLMPATVTAITRAGVTAYAAAWDVYRKPPTLPTPVRKKKKVDQKRIFLSYRISKEIEQGVQEISTSTGVPVGEVFLRLLEIGIQDHINMDYRIVPTAEVVYSSGTWERTKRE